MFRVCRLGALLKLLPRGVFDRAVQEQTADKHRKGFSCWAQLVAMLYGQLSGATSARALVSRFNAHATQHYHLGCGELRRSTLCEANAKDLSAVLAATVEALMQLVSRSVRAHSTKAMKLIDSTSITLKGEGFDQWTKAHRTRNTQGVKLHVVFELSTQAPSGQWISFPNVNDVEYARALSIQAGALYVFDKAYCDYSWWWRIEQSRASFVTRLKSNARIEVLSERRVPWSAGRVICKDERIRLCNPNPGGGRSNPYSKALRRLEVARLGEAPLVLITNDFKRTALQIAEAYRARWQIELFFKWIKQHLKIKRFFGRSENAVRTQILTALIAYLLVVLDHHTQRLTISLWEHLNLLQSTLMQRPSIETQRHREWREHRARKSLLQRELFA